MSDAFLQAYARTRGFLLGRPGRFAFSPDAATLFFLRSQARHAELALYALDVASGVCRELVTAAQLVGAAALSLSAEERARRERQRITDLGLTAFEVSADGRGLLLPLAGRLYWYELASGAVHRVPTPAADAGGAIDARLSPDGTHVLFVWRYDVYAAALSPGARPVRLTTGGTSDTPNGVAEFVAQEEMARFEGTWWSPDSRWVAFAAVDERAVERFAIADPAHPERPPATFRYPRPGKLNAEVRLGVVDAARALAAPAQEPPAPLWLEWDRARFPYLARVLWQSPQAPLALWVQSRDQRQAALYAADATFGSCRLLRVESDAAWINLERGLPRWLPDGSGFLAVREDAAGRALVRWDAEGADAGVVLAGDAGFLQLVQVDPSARTLLALVGDALESRLVAVELTRPRAPVPLTPEPGDREVVAARDGSAFVETRVAPDGLPVSTVRDGRGAAPLVVPSVAEPPPFRVRLELTEVEAQPEGVDHPLRFATAIVRPRSFKSGDRLPVIVHVYGGPHANMVKADERHYLFDQWLADHGVAVVIIDNRGTPRRGPAWERALKGDLIDVPLRDQVAALGALAARYPELDTARVGIYGWSFGGSMAAAAVLRYPQVFHVAVAGAPVTDFRDYDTHYTERYLDLPDVAAAAYDATSLMGDAAGLVRPLLLVHGTADDNVYFFHSLRLAEALLRAGRPFAFLPLPGVTHQIADPEVREQVWTRTAAFLLEGLGLPPPV